MPDDYRKKRDESSDGIPSLEEMEEQIRILKESGEPEDPLWEEKFKQLGKENTKILEEIRRKLNL